MSDPKRKSEVRAYHPTWQDRIGVALAGDKPLAPETRRFVEGLVGSTGLGTIGPSVINAAPVLGQAVAAQERWAAGDYQGMVMAVLPFGLKPSVSLPKSPVNAMLRNEAGFDPKPRPAVDFAHDYKPKAIAGLEEGSALSRSIEGEPLVAKYVAGRRAVGGANVGLTPGEIEQVAAEIAMSVRRVPRADLPRAHAVGSFNPKNDSIKVLETLSADDQTRVVAHETGHLLSNQTTNGDSWAVPQKLVAKNRTVYHELATGEANAPASKQLGPEFYGYPKRDINAELNAEFVRMYMTNPAAAKTANPEMAKFVRQQINPNKQFNKTIQFNSVAPVVAGGAALAAFGDKSEAHPQPSKIVHVQGTGTFKRTYKTGPKAGLTEMVHRK